MIKASELRIGNWVENVSLVAFGGKYMRVNGMFIRQVEYCKTGDANHRGIPLNPEILEKAGFGWSENIHRWKHSSGYQLIQHNFGFENGVGDGSFKQPPLEHLHQLQNLYFVLTGEELNIEL